MREFTKNAYITKKIEKHTGENYERIRSYLIQHKNEFNDLFQFYAHSGQLSSIAAFGLIYFITKLVKSQKNETLDEYIKELKKTPKNT